MEVQGEKKKKQGITYLVLATIAGTTILCVLEFVTYGLLLPEFIAANRFNYPGLFKDPPDILPFILINLVWASFLCYTSN
jgi:riboflavin transporter FmnP